MWAIWASFGLAAWAAAAAGMASARAAAIRVLRIICRPPEGRPDGALRDDLMAACPEGSRTRFLPHRGRWPRGSEGVSAQNAQLRGRGGSPLRHVVVPLPRTRPPAWGRNFGNLAPPGASNPHDAKASP